MPCSRTSFLTIVATLTGVALLGSAQTLAQSPKVVTLAEYPSGNFLENLDTLPDGRIVFTSYFAKTIEVIDKAKKVSTLARLSAHPVSIIALNDGYLVSAHGLPFTSGPGFVETQQFLLLDKSGKETGGFKAPDARFLNGMVRHTGQTVLVADSIAATIWRVDPKAQSIKPWLQDPALAQDPSVKEFRPGANGLKRDGSRLLISNSSRGTLSAVRVDKQGAPVLPVAVVKQVGPIDDFLVEKSGRVVFTTHGAKLLRLSKTGQVTSILETGCDGCTAVALTKGRDGKDALVVLTTGGLAEGRKEAARVLLVPYRR